MKNLKTSESQAYSFELEKQGQDSKAFILRHASNKIDRLTMVANFITADNGGEKEIRKQVREEIARTRKFIQSTLNINLITDIDGYVPLGMRCKPTEEAVVK